MFKQFECSTPSNREVISECNKVMRCYVTEQCSLLLFRADIYPPFNFRIVMPSLFFSKEIITFASQFPQYAATIFTWTAHFTTFASNLSPKAQANAMKMVKSIYHLFILAAQKMIEIYQAIMAKTGPQSLTDWEKPSTWILYPLASFILFILPINHSISDQKDSFKNKTVMFINNRHIYGLEVIPLLALIYCQTGIWARVEAETYHFRIPLWAQLIQYFGAYERRENVESTQLLLNSNHSVLISPGGKNDTFSSSYDLKWPSGFISGLETPMIVPISIVGFNDMVSVLTSIDFSPLLWILGYKTVSKSATTVPIFFFQSFERVYIWFGPMNTYSEEETVDMVKQGLLTVLDRQANDPDRILLKSVRNLVETGWSYVKPFFLKIQPILYQFSCKFYEWSVDALEKMD